MFHGGSCLSRRRRATFPEICPVVGCVGGRWACRGARDRPPADAPAAPRRRTGPVLPGARRPFPLAFASCSPRSVKARALRAMRSTSTAWWGDGFGWQSGGTFRWQLVDASGSPRDERGTALVGSYEDLAKAEAPARGTKRGNLRARRSATPRGMNGELRSSGSYEKLGRGTRRRRLPAGRTGALRSSARTKTWPGTRRRRFPAGPNGGNRARRLVRETLWPGRDAGGSPRDEGGKPGRRFRGRQLGGHRQPSRTGPSLGPEAQTPQQRLVFPVDTP